VAERHGLDYWLKMGTGCKTLRAWYLNFRLHKMWLISWLFEDLLACQKSTLIHAVSYSYIQRFTAYMGKAHDPSLGNYGCVSTSVLMTVQLPSVLARENISLDKIYCYIYKQTTSTSWIFVKVTKKMRFPVFWDVTLLLGEWPMTSWRTASNHSNSNTFSHPTRL